MTVTLNLPSCFMLANIKQFATLFVFSSFLILWCCVKCLPLQSLQRYGPLYQNWSHPYTAAVFTSLPNSEGRDGVVSPMQGCLFYQVSKLRARGLIFNLRREKPSGALWVRFILPPSNSISQSSQKWRPFTLFNLFALLPLLFPAIDFAHHKLYCR